MNYEEVLTNYGRSELRSVLQEKHYRNFELTEEKRIQFEGYASDIVRYFLKVFMSYKNTCIAEKDVDICCKYLFDDKQTVAGLAEEYHDSVENLQKLIPEYTAKLRYAYNYRNKYLNEIDFVLSQIPEEGLIHFVAFGFLSQYSRRMSQFMLQCLFNDMAEWVIEAAEGLLCGVCDMRGGGIENFISKACFPGGRCAKLNFNEIGAENNPVEFRGQEKLFLRLSQSGEVKKIIRYPKIVYYSTKNTKHAPFCCLQTKDNRIILIVMSPAINMAVCYNLKRFRALHAFCKENGLGYIITDGKLNTITDIINFKVNERVSKMLFEILSESGRITQKDVNWLRERYNFTDKAIAAFVIRNRLKFTLNPFVITYE